MRILVTFALENEFAPWHAMRKFRPGKWGEVNVYRAEVGFAEVGVVLTGAGPKQAHSEGAKVLGSDPESINLCVSSGLAGALKSQYQVGQILAARSVRTEAELTDPSSNPLSSSFTAPCVWSVERKRSATWASTRTPSRWKALRYSWNRPHTEFRRSQFAPSVTRLTITCRSI